jgi:hypothetical protein
VEVKNQKDGSFRRNIKAESHPRQVAMACSEHADFALIQKSKSEPQQERSLYSDVIRFDDACRVSLFCIASRTHSCLFYHVRIFHRAPHWMIGFNLTA